MEIETFFKHCENIPGRTFPPDSEQKEIIKHDIGPLWVVAGPGSGKTDSIVLRCLKLLIVDMVNPKSIMLTTFTEKAARNLEDRISTYMQYFISVDPSLVKIDFTQVRVGTLHGLANDIMQEFRYSGYQNFRLLTELEQTLFILEHSSFIGNSEETATNFGEIWKDEFLAPYFERFSSVTNSRWSNKSVYPPNRWIRASVIKRIFNTIVEENIDVEGLKDSEKNSGKLIFSLYNEYIMKLSQLKRSDFAHLQVRFMKFLNSNESKLFVHGNGTDNFPGLHYLMVDEYQDTNAIQESIYFKLTESTGNICVVGDDDQSLYRFRGGKVELMIEFPEKCKKTWVDKHVKTIFLVTNYRSHEKIVKACDGFITSYQNIGKGNYRVKGKPSLIPGSEIRGDYPAASYYTERFTGARGTDIDALAVFFVKMVSQLKENNVINDYSECALLMPSTKNSSNYAGKFMEKLSLAQIPFYNPRGTSILEEDEVMTILGAFVEIIDPPANKHHSQNLKGIKTLVDSWRNKFSEISKDFPDLKNYVETLSKNIQRKGKSVNIGANAVELLYYVMGLEPFITWLGDPVKSIHLGLITQVFDAFSNVPTSRNNNLMMGAIYTSSRDDSPGVSYTWRGSFYLSLIALITELGLNEDEDPMENFPEGMIPIMTIHQSKGLEFPFVFVYGLSLWKPDLENVMLEEILRTYSDSSHFQIEEDEALAMAELDLARMFFVAYSRAQHALILLANKGDLKSPGIGCGGYGWNMYYKLPKLEAR